MMIKVAILGVGLIGGSLALCFRGKPGIHVTGYSPNSVSTAKYVELGVVDSATTSLVEAVHDADFIFICSPVGILNEMLVRLSALPLKRGCVVTDVGSTKASVSKCAQELDWQGVHFIGGHPMAGSERSGVEAASVLLFENAYYVLTPEPGTDEEAYQRLTNLLLHTRAHLIRMNPVEHDRVVGAISHLPHIVATALVNQVRHYNEDNDMYVLLAAGGFRDITRIASSDPTIWSDILINNRGVMLDLLTDWKASVEQWIDVLENQDSQFIRDSFMNSGEFRGRMPERRKGVIHSLYELYVDVPDEPGIIGRITTELGNHNVNLSNVQIIESREDVPGVLRLSFRDQKAWDAAKGLLSTLGFTVYV
ncbi:prephenate dehydrogenase [Paenibacillus marinisediminis]